MLEDLINFYIFVGFNIGWIVGVFIGRKAIINTNTNNHKTEH